MSGNQANGKSTLCARCLSIFKIEQEPGYLTSQSVPNVKTTVAHHDSEASFKNAIQNDCFICRSLNTESPAQGGYQGGPFTRATLHMTGDGEYTVAIFLTKGAEGQLGKVTYFTATQVSNSMSLNVPVDHHEELIKKWVSECQSGTGSHATCQRSRAAHQSLQTPRQLRRIIQLMVDATSGDILYQLQDLEAIKGKFLGVPYVTVSHHDVSSRSRPSLPVETGGGLSTWHTVTHLPAWLQETAKTAIASSINHLWEPMMCHDGEENDAEIAEIYAVGVFNIAHLADPNSGRRDVIPLVSPSWAPQHLLALYQGTMFRDTVVDSPLWTMPSFHQALLLSPATLFFIEGGDGQKHLWWQCADGALYSNTAASGVTIGDSVSFGDKTDNPGIRMVGTHTLDIQALLAQFLHPDVQTKQRYASPADRLAALWTSVAMAYSQVEPNEAKEKGLQDTADVVRRLALNPNSSDDMRKAMETYAYGAWSGGLIYQLAWHGDPLRQEELPQSRQQLPSWSWLSHNGPIVFEFLLSEGAAGLNVQHLDPMRAHIGLVAMAEFEPNDYQSKDSPATRIRARGRLLQASADLYHETGGLQLVSNSDYVGVHFDCADEEVRALGSKGGSYIVWPIFAQVDDNGRIESRGLIIRQVLTNQHVDIQTLPVFILDAIS
ncbi:hypothetical protein GQ44DRAFT_770882 [Phaeosphaeriaceae sp. PMI808]|nr:hypothetical protein GQ44DRAFT_770882 [Phaeosphaeriaceae sp. PMI808]